MQADHAEHFQVIGRLLREHPELEETGFDDLDFGLDAGSVATNFEIKYVREGREMYRIAVVRRRPEP